MSQNEFMETEGLGLWDNLGEPGKGAAPGVLCIYKSTDVRLQDEELPWLAKLLEILAQAQQWHSVAEILHLI